MSAMGLWLACNSCRSTTAVSGLSQIDAGVSKLVAGMDADRDHLTWSFNTHHEKMLKGLVHTLVERGRQVKGSLCRTMSPI